MKAVFLHDKQAIAGYFQRDPALHLYAIGDLDDFFWPYTTWYALQDGAAINALALLYTGTDLPVLLATERPPAVALTALLRRVQHLLPRRLYAHLTPEARDTLAEYYELDPHGPHLKMRLDNPAALNGIDTSAVEQLTTDHMAELTAFYQRSYPGNWFDPRMLETGQYFGLRDHGELVSAAGIHVYSPTYRVAALGNITTLPAMRGRGLATVVTAALCKSLSQSVDHVGLNVHADNQAAIACYARLGFAIAAEYGEFMLTARQTA